MIKIACNVLAFYKSYKNESLAQKK